MSKHSLESTATLLKRVQDGDNAAREQLCAQFLPILTRWAHGRLPTYARDLAETDDMVQSALLKALDKVDDFDALREGAFLAYLRKILLNNIRMEIRRIGRRNQHGVTDHDAEVIDGEASVLQRVIGADALDRYESALAELTPGAREAVILRVEFGYTFPEIAAATEANSANTARMLVTRSLVKVAEQMR